MEKRLCIDIDLKILNALKKRAKRELFSLKELIEDILRRSAISSAKKQSISGKGDKFIEYFSREKYKKRKTKRGKK